MNHQLSPHQRPCRARDHVHEWLRLSCVIVCLALSFLASGSLVAQETATEAVPVEAAEAAATAPSLPDKVPVGKLSTNIIDMFNSMGVWVIPFAVASIIFLWFTVDRLVVLRRGRVIPKPFVQRFLRLLESGELEQDEALEVCLENQSPIANVFAHAVRKWGKSSVEVEQACIDGGERQVADLRRNLKVLHGIHVLTPMLGLLGTVWGMLESFSQLADAGSSGRTDQLASGIALALVTTVAGLVISIPALMMYLYFSSRIDALVMEMDDLAQRVVHCISAEGLVGRMGRPKKTVTAASKPEPETAAARKR